MAAAKVVKGPEFLKWLILTVTAALAFGLFYALVLCTVSGMIQYFTITLYMSPFAIISNQLLLGYAWSEKHLLYYGIGYLTAVYITIFPSVWYWRLIGVLG